MYEIKKSPLQLHKKKQLVPPVAKLEQGEWFEFTSSQLGAVSEEAANVARSTGKDFSLRQTAPTRFACVRIS